MTTDSAGLVDRPSPDLESEVAPPSCQSACQPSGRYQMAPDRMDTEPDLHRWTTPVPPDPASATCKRQVGGSSPPASSVSAVVSP